MLPTPLINPCQTCDPATSRWNQPCPKWWVRRSSRNLPSETRPSPPQAARRLPRCRSRPHANQYPQRHTVTLLLKSSSSLATVRKKADIPSFIPLCRGEKPTLECEAVRETFTGPWLAPPPRKPTLRVEIPDRISNSRVGEAAGCVGSAKSGEANRLSMASQASPANFAGLAIQPMTMIPGERLVDQDKPTSRSSKA